MRGMPALINGERQDRNRSENEVRTERSVRQLFNAIRSGKSDACLASIPNSQINEAVELAKRFGALDVHAVGIACKIAWTIEKFGRDQALTIATNHFFLCQAREILSALKGNVSAEASFGDECQCAECRA